MAIDKQSNLPNELARARDRFQSWRNRRPVGSPIPESFWNLAVKVACRHGLSLTARVLRLDYYNLKKRVDGGNAQVPCPQTGFVQLPSPLPPCKQAVFYLEPGTGTRLRVQLLGYDTGDLETLLRHLGSKG